MKKKKKRKKDTRKQKQKNVMRREKMSNIRVEINAAWEEYKIIFKYPQYVNKRPLFSPTEKK